MVYCTVYGEEISRTAKPIAKTKHAYVDTVVAPTTEAQGYTEHKCSLCGDTYRETYTEKLATSGSTVIVTPKFIRGEEKTYTDIRLTAGGKTLAADSTGKVTLTGLANGTYEATVTKPKYAQRKVSIKVDGTNSAVVIYRYGDVTGDGEIDTEDIARMQQKISEWRVSYVYPETADLDGDGERDTRDLARLQQYISGWNVTLGKNPYPVPAG